MKPSRVDNAGLPGDRSVDVFIRKVRNKLRLHSPRWSYVHTHFGAGYRFEARPGGAPIDTDAPLTASEVERLEPEPRIQRRN